MVIEPGGGLPLGCTVGDVSGVGPGARRIVECLDIHYTPKHGRWLNMAEISAMVGSCLNCRFPDRPSDHPCSQNQGPTRKR